MTRVMTKELKFKKGDTVRVIEDTYEVYFPKGKAVIQSNNDGGIVSTVKSSMFDLLGLEMVLLEDMPKGAKGWYWESELEKIDETNT